MSVRRACPAPTPPSATVPDLLGRRAEQVGELAAGAGVVAVLNYRPQARQKPGTVVAVHPAAGSAVGRGSTVQVSVAGRPAADQPGTGKPGTARAGAGRPAARRVNRGHRVVAGGPTSAELENIRSGVSAALLRTAGFAVRVDPVTSAVRVTGDIPAEVATALTELYGQAVVVLPAEPVRRAG